MGSHGLAFDWCKFGRLTRTLPSQTGDIKIAIFALSPNGDIPVHTLHRRFCLCCVAECVHHSVSNHEVEVQTRPGHKSVNQVVIGSGSPLGGGPLRWNRDGEKMSATVTKLAYWNVSGVKTCYSLSTSTRNGTFWLFAVILHRISRISNLTMRSTAIARGAYVSPLKLSTAVQTLPEYLVHWPTEICHFFCVFGMNQKSNLDRSQSNFSLINF